MTKLRRPGYGLTLAASFLGYMVQATGNFVPLLYVTFHRQLGVSFADLSLLLTVNFSVQMLMDLLGARYADRIGWRRCLVAAHLFGAAGMAGLSVLPDLTRSPFTGILIAQLLCAVGNGLLEVLVSPVVETCPTKNKAAAMSLLHSFYCWGYVLTVLVSTGFFSLFGVGNWRVMARLWAVLPLVNAGLFCIAPLAPFPPAQAGGSAGIAELVRDRRFWLLIWLMVCAGGCEQGMSQWASAFAEDALGCSKAVGDLFGPLAFAALMGLSRVLQARLGGAVPLRRLMQASGALCLASYLLAALCGSPALALLGCGVCGFSVGVLWPGVFSMATGLIARGGTALFALLALGGDVGCMAAPSLVGLVSGRAGNDLRAGLTAALIFPLLLLIGLALCPPGPGEQGGKRGRAAP